MASGMRRRDFALSLGTVLSTVSAGARSAPRGDERPAADPSWTARSALRLGGRRLTASERLRELRQLHPGAGALSAPIRLGARRTHTASAALYVRGVLHASSNEILLIAPRVDVVRLHLPSVRANQPFLVDAVVRTQRKLDVELSTGYGGPVATTPIPRNQWVHVLAAFAFPKTGFAAIALTHTDTGPGYSGFKLRSLDVSLPRAVSTSQLAPGISSSGT